MPSRARNCEIHARWKDVAVVRPHALSADGQTIAASSDGGMVSIWDLVEMNAVRAQPLDHACGMTQRALDSSEWNRYLAGLPYMDACAAIGAD
jgi:WD40 repeat protein